MSWFERDGEELANLILLEILNKEDSCLSKDEVFKIIDSDVKFGFKRILYHADKCIEEMGITRDSNGFLRI